MGMESVSTIGFYATRLIEPKRRNVDRGVTIPTSEPYS